MQWIYHKTVIIPGIHLSLEEAFKFCSHSIAEELLNPNRFTFGTPWLSSAWNFCWWGTDISSAKWPKWRGASRDGCIHRLHLVLRKSCSCSRPHLRTLKPLLMAFNKLSETCFKFPFNLIIGQSWHIHKSWNKGGGPERGLWHCFADGHGFG